MTVEERRRRYYQRNRERVLAYKQAWRESNRDRFNATRRLRRADKRLDPVREAELRQRYPFVFEEGGL